MFGDRDVKLNIGGAKFETTIGTLRRVPHTLLDSIFSQKFEDILKQEDGSVFIDRDGTYF